jgi:hypothetical protein
LDKRLGGLQSRSGRGGEKKKSQPLPGLEPPIIQPVATVSLRYILIISVKFTMFLEIERTRTLDFVQTRLVKVKLSLCFSTDHRAMNVYWGMEI